MIMDSERAMHVLSRMREEIEAFEPSSSAGRSWRQMELDAVDYAISCIKFRNEACFTMAGAIVNMQAVIRSAPNA